MRIVVLLMVLGMLHSCYSPERNCSNFKVGTFEFKALVGTELLTTTFVRNDSIEIDYFQGKSRLRFRLGVCGQTSQTRTRLNI